MPPASEGGGGGGDQLGMDPPADNWGNVTVGDVSLMACVHVARPAPVISFGKQWNASCFWSEEIVACDANSIAFVHRRGRWPDFYFGYIFTSKAATEATINTDKWVGGYNLDSIDGAERYSYGAYRAYRDSAPPQWLNKTQLNSTYMGTCTGFVLSSVSQLRAAVVHEVLQSMRHPRCT